MAVLPVVLCSLGAVSLAYFRAPSIVYVLHDEATAYPFSLFKGRTLRIRPDVVFLGVAVLVRGDRYRGAAGVRGLLMASFI